MAQIRLRLWRVLTYLCVWILCFVVTVSVSVNVFRAIRFSFSCLDFVRKYNLRYLRFFSMNPVESSCSKQKSVLFLKEVMYGVCCFYQNITYIILVRGRGVVERYCGSTALMLVLLFV